ncbi:MAG: hypothetical protein GY926_26420 [bacterium]|nr:hypothetical protein [bacterium]
MLSEQAQATATKDPVRRRDEGWVISRAIGACDRAAVTLLDDLSMEFKAFDLEWSDVLAESLTEISGRA